MVTAFYGVKGGVGVTTVTAIAAIVSARRSGAQAIDTLAVDTAGDLSAALGCDATIQARDRDSDAPSERGFVDCEGGDTARRGGYRVGEQSAEAVGTDGRRRSQ